MRKTRFETSRMGPINQAKCHITSTTSRHNSRRAYLTHIWNLLVLVLYYANIFCALREHTVFIISRAPFGRVLARYALLQARYLQVWEQFLAN